METDPQAWTKHWTMVTELGLCTVVQDGGTLADQASALTAAAQHLVPGPVLPVVLGGILGLPEVTAITLGGAITLTGDHATGAAEPVLGTDGHVLFRAGDVWCTVEHPVTPLNPLDFSRPLGRLTLDDTPVVRHDLDDVEHLLATLFAAEAAGVARWCLDTATAYAKIREQFDRPIGSFQAVKHLCAEMLCRAEQTAALAWDAARAPDSLSAPAAAALALDAAVDNAKDCVQVLGGIGFTWEHDAHLYLRRALANRQLLGGGARWRRRVADLALAGERRRLDVVAEDPEVRAAAREFAAGLTGLPTHERRERLADSGYLAPHWPRPYGLAASPRAQLVIAEELANAGIRRPDLVVGAWAVPTILTHGTDEQRRRFVPPTLRGELRWCQLFSEPGAGSDLASLRTRAVRVDGGWHLSGQKVWTSVADEADWAICLARTDPAAPKHDGITYFLVDMRSAGITLRPLREITGEARFNEVFLDEVFVPDDRVVGEVGGGWKLARATLANERVALGGGSSLGEGVERLLSLVGDLDDGARERVGSLVTQGLSVSLVDLRATLRQLDGRGPGPESSVSKLIGVRQRQDVAETALELLGPAGAVVDEATGTAVHEFLLTRCLSIAGGTTQVLRNLVGERILGLPREKH
ncbi:acyl-CoA dehydrogenase family protein [Actinophytocola sp.]|uniref:acyl-CoA dehydrogenase family protein n=1 Tax=Actinophytocola sp. TaxID=1872138 RepID=UPI003899A838